MLNNHLCERVESTFRCMQGVSFKEPGGKPQKRAKSASVNRSFWNLVRRRRDEQLNWKQRFRTRIDVKDAKLHQNKHLQISEWTADQTGRVDCKKVRPPRHGRDGRKVDGGRRTGKPGIALSWPLLRALPSWFFLSFLFSSARSQRFRGWRLWLRRRRGCRRG
jgi:hypothetical protein